MKYRALTALPTLYRRLSWRLGAARRMPMLPARLFETLGAVSSAVHGISARWRRLPRGLRLVRLDAFDWRADVLWEQAKDRYGVAVVRDQRFLNWRFVRTPRDRYELLAAVADEQLLGYAVVKVVERPGVRIGYLVDCLTLSPTLDRAVVAGALGLLAARRMDFALCRAQCGGPLDAALRDCGFEEREEFPRTPVVYRVFAPELESVLAQAERWHLTYGDHLDVDLDA